MPGSQAFTGVMTQAVDRDATGFYTVDYGMLGIEMQSDA